MCLPLGVMHSVLMNIYLERDKIIQKLANSKFNFSKLWIIILMNLQC